MIYIARDNRQQVKISGMRMEYVQFPGNSISNYWSIKPLSIASFPFIWLQNDDFPQVKKGEQWTLNTETLQMERIESHD